MNAQDLSESETLRCSREFTLGSVNDRSHSACFVFHSDRFYSGCHSDRRTPLFDAPDIGSDRLLVDQRSHSVVDQDDIIVTVELCGGAEPVIYKADEDADYDEVLTVDLSEIEPTVAFPHLPENARTFAEIGDVKIDQAVIGSCTNGRLEDLIAAAEIMKGRKAAKHVRVIVIPATQQIYLDAMEMGLIRTFIEFGAVVSTPTCGPCLGGYMGILAAGERAITTTNRNFVGRMGDPTSEVYLASPAVCAASAVAGHIALPSDL